MSTFNQDETARLIKIAVFVLVRSAQSLYGKEAPFNDPEIVFMNDKNMIAMAKQGYKKAYYIDLEFEAALGDCFREICPSLGVLFKDTREGEVDNSALFFDLCASFADAEYANASRQYYNEFCALEI